MASEQNEDDQNATDLSSLSVHEVSLVKRGANKRKFALWKSEDFKMKDLTAAILSSPGNDGNDEIVKQMVIDGISKEGQSTIEDAMKLLSAVKEELNSGLLDKIQSALGLKAEESQSEFDRGEESEGARVADEEKSQSEFDRGEESEGTSLSDKGKLKSEEELEKGPDDPLAKALLKAYDDPRIKALFKSNEELQSKIQKHEDEKREKEFIQKADEHYSMVPGASSQEVGILLRELDDISPSLCGKVEGILKSTNAFAKNSGIFSEQGTSQNESISGISNQNDFDNEIEKMAKHRVAKTGEPYLKAYEKTLKENQDLYSKSIGWR